MEKWVSGAESSEAKLFLEIRTLCLRGSKRPVRLKWHPAVRQNSPQSLDQGRESPWPCMNVIHCRPCLKFSSHVWYLHKIIIVQFSALNCHQLSPSLHHSPYQPVAWNGLKNKLKVCREPMQPWLFSETFPRSRKMCKVIRFPIAVSEGKNVGPLSCRSWKRHLLIIRLSGTDLLLCSG